MAFGDLTKGGFVDESGTTVTNDLGSNPASGSLLICASGAQSATNAITTPPSGMTELTSNFDGTGGGWIWWYKISDGTEQTAVVVWTEGFHVQRYAEYEWDGSTPTVITNDDITNISTVVNSQASGAATPTGSTNICIAAHGSGNENDHFVGQAVDGSWIEDFAYIESSRGGVKLSRLVNVTGSQEATHSDTDVGNEMYGISNPS